MANTIFRSSGYQIRAFQVLGLLLCLTVLVQKVSCTPNNFTIGGSKGWSVPDDPNAPHYNAWAEKNRFEIGDSIVFVYPADKDSVLIVNQENYNNCNTDHPLQKFYDGNTVYTFQESGPHYFISGNKDNCLKNEKVIVVVLADRSNRTNSTSPSAETPPSPAPAGQESPSPPAETVNINPAPAPVSEPPPAPSSATSVCMSFIGYSGALVAASSLLF